MNDITKTYEDGIMQGEINTLITLQKKQEARLDSHSDRLKQLERIMWLLLGGLAMLEVLPRIYDFAQKMTN